MINALINFNNRIYRYQAGFYDASNGAQIMSQITSPLNKTTSNILRRAYYASFLVYGWASGACTLYWCFHKRLIVHLIIQRFKTCSNKLDTFSTSWFHLHGKLLVVYDFCPQKKKLIYKIHNTTSLTHEIHIFWRPAHDADPKQECDKAGGVLNKDKMVCCASDCNGE